MNNPKQELRRAAEAIRSAQALLIAAGAGMGVDSDSLQIDVDQTTIRSDSQTPVCPECGEIARPNILMFHDRSWVDDRSEEQARRYKAWLRKIDSAQLVVIEMGAGLAVPSVRYESECSGGRLIRINPRDPATPEDGISLPLGALAGLRHLDEIL